MTFKSSLALLTVVLTAGTCAAQTAAPSILGLNPSSIAAGSAGFYLSVIGANFQNGAVVFWSGLSLGTGFQNSGTLTAFVPPGLITSPGFATITVTNPGGVQSNGVGFAITANPVSIVSSSLPAGVAGTAYTASLVATGGSPPYTWAAAGTFPPGLALNPSTGTISGTPTVSGSYTFTVRVTDSQGGTATKSLSLLITGLSITTPSPLPTGTANQPYAQTLAATGGTPPYTWAASLGIPAGLTLNPATGSLSGTPSTAGTFSFAVQVTDATKQSAIQTFTLTINPSPLSITTLPPLFAGTVGTSYTQTFNASGGVPPYTWSMTTGSVPGLAFTSNANQGLLSGIPTTPGTFPLTIQVTDAVRARSSQGFSIIVNTPTLTITVGAPLPAGSVGVDYSQKFQVVASGGTPPYTWSLTSGSVPGLTFDASNLALAGNPTTAGTFTLNLQVSDSAGLTAVKSFSVTIAPASLAITGPRQLPDAALNAPYSQALAASGGLPPYSWSASGLPAGLTINAASGLISGAPTVAGNISFAVTVTDSALANSSDRFTINVHLPSAPPVTISGLPGTVNPAAQFPLQIALGSVYPAPISGQAILSFSPDSGPGDKTILFANGSTTANFTVPAGSTIAVSDVPLALQTGTVSGIISISLRLSAGNLDITPSPAPTITAQVLRAAPVITDIQISRSSNGISLVITGYSTAREVTQATFAFNAAAGQTLQPAAASITVDVSGLFGGWFASSVQGSQFIFTQPFTVQGDPNAVIPVSVTLTNRVGPTTKNLAQ